LRKAGGWALKQVGAAATAVVTAGKAVGTATVVAGVAVGTQAKRVDDHLKNTDAALASGIRTRTQTIRSEHAARMQARRK
jgi:hypothetical protein